MIPRRLLRTVPEHTTPQVEAWWDHACAISKGWDAVTFRDPLDPEGWPLTGHLWDLCTSGAQKAGLIRLEALWSHGGVYLDSDLELYRPLDSLVHLPAFAAWEDGDVVPDAVIGAEPFHPAIRECILDAERRITSDVTDWRTGNGAWSTGPGVTTSIFPNREDVLLLPPGAFYAVHYTQKHNLGTRPEPFEFGRHHWHGSWVDPTLEEAHG